MPLFLSPQLLTLGVPPGCLTPPFSPKVLLLGLEPGSGHMRSPSGGLFESTVKVISRRNAGETCDYDENRALVSSAAKKCRAHRVVFDLPHSIIQVELPCSASDTPASRSNRLVLFLIGPFISTPALVRAAASLPFSCILRIDCRTH
jgi:hypothetical protein